MQEHVEHRNCMEHPEPAQPPVRRFPVGRVVSALTGAAAAVSIGLLFLGHTHAGADPAAERKEYSAHILETYTLPFGKDQLFLPSNAKSDGNQFIQPGAFPTAEYCRHCHEESFHQWRESLHANSFRTPFYMRNVELLNKARGMEPERHCEGCHNPIALFSGAVTTKSQVTDRKFDQDGVTCSVCHSIQKLQPTYGLGAYVMGVPAVMVDEKGQPIPGEAKYEDILAHTDRHKAAVMKDFYKSPEFCAACHKANLPDSLNNYKWLRAIGLYDEWQASSVSHRSPLPFYKKDLQTCQTCHMQKEKLLLTDYGAKDGQLASHRWVGGNTAVPFYYGYEDQLKKTIDYLRDKKLNVDLFAIRKTDSKGGESEPIAPLGSVPVHIAPNDLVEAMVVIQNKGIGHTLIPEQRDMYEAWAEFVVKDANGREISHSGYLNADGTLDKTAHSFVTRLLNSDGEWLQKHEIWYRRTIATDATIRPGRSTLVRYQFRVPADAKGPITVTARVNYRHLNQGTTNFMLSTEKHPAYPVVDMAERTRTFTIGDNPAGAPGQGEKEGDNPDWMRWNNFGIALLDQQQYSNAVDAFERVVKMRPDYPDAYTNVGLAYISWEKYPLAEASLEKALSLAPGDPRALYYRALVKRNEGNVEGAISDLEKVTAAFPQSPDAHRELGFSYYQLHKYEAAGKQYEAVQGIDPDDLAAHYILSIVYRRLGQKDKAAREAALFANEKDDPMASTATLKFLQAHPELSEESVPWHLHPANEGAGAKTVAVGGGQ